MLIGILAGLLGGTIIALVAGSSGDTMSIVAGAEIEDVIDDVVEDEERRDRIEGIIDESDDFRSETNDAYNEVLGQFTDLAASRDSEPADFEQLVAGFGTEARMEQVLDLRFRLKGELTEEEWNTLYGDLEMPE